MRICGLGSEKYPPPFERIQGAPHSWPPRVKLKMQRLPWQFDRRDDSACPRDPFIRETTMKISSAVRGLVLVAIAVSVAIAFANMAFEPVEKRVCFRSSTLDSCTWTHP
jgi:hypothetical protein